MFIVIENHHKILSDYTKTVVNGVFDTYEEAFECMLSQQHLRLKSCFGADKATYPHRAWVRCSDVWEWAIFDTDMDGQYVCFLDWDKRYELA